ncbi:MAG: sulfatase-like hydrolase/transferase [Fimbriimonadaceae bacterium]|nr:sulfatase-like hydrolase/transferase [Chitinophagales bacterium]
MKTLLRKFSAVIYAIILVSTTTAQTQPNIVFVTIDDLNDYVQGFDGHPQVETPNLYELAQKGVTFYNAYCSSPQCAPSRTSFLTGKDLKYTQLYDNGLFKAIFTNNFTDEKNNSEYLTIPGYFKDEGNYYTYSLNKIFHGYDEYSEYDVTTVDPCEKSLSWNKAFYYLDSSFIFSYGIEHNEGLSNFQWCRLPDSMEQYMMDKVMIDSAIQFIDQVASGADVTCGKPFFLGIGIKKPHVTWFIPEHYFNSNYMTDIYQNPLDLPYNSPVNASPSNGIIMPPQPAVEFADFLALPFVAKAFVGQVNTRFNTYESTITPYPIINSDFTAAEKEDAIKESMRANAVIAYLASIKYLDYHFGRFMDELETHPEIYNNTIIVVLGDHGYGLGEKKHWGKTGLWETDTRAPFFIVDLRNVATKRCDQTVSFLDIFPTLCDMADLPYPTFSDGSDYLDGISLTSVMANPAEVWERPVISTKENTYMQEGSCFPQISVRDDRFHYINYHSNNSSLGTSPCNAATSILEEELYDIGVNRETDPYEFKNLAGDPDYDPVKEYLKEFLTDGDLYLQKANKVQITTASVSCLLNNSAILRLKPKVYSSNGILLTGAALTGYSFEWTNNITSDVFMGRNYNFNMATIPTATYASESEILFYLKVTNTATGKLAGFDTKTYYFNPANAPVISYNTSVSGHDVSIIDYSITGSYTNTNWAYGDGASSEDFLPAPHSYAATGTYLIKNTAYYGNKPTCRVTLNKVVAIAGPPLKEGPVVMEIYPNPAYNKINVVLPYAIANADVQILNTFGQIVLSEHFKYEGNGFELNILSLPTGNYFIKVINEGAVFLEQFEVVK